ncbi:MAG: PEGA domain-containing protein [Polyangiaceae bacterium]
MRVTACLSLAIFLAAAPALADGSDAESIIAHGVELREQGHDDQALAEFRRAFALAPSARARAQIALAEQALGLWVNAEIDLLEATKDKSDPWIAKNRAALTQSLAVIQQHLGSLEIRGGSAGGEVFVDGASVGALPMATGKRVEAGTRNVEVRAKGFYTASRVVTVPPAGIARETIELRPQLASGPDGQAPGAIGAAPVKSEEPKSTSNVQRTLGWVFLGAGAAVVVTGIVGQLLRQSAISAYNADRSCPGLGSPTQPPGCDGNVSAASTWQTVSIVGFAAGGALSVSGVILVVTAPTHRGDVASIGWAGRF